MSRTPLVAVLLALCTCPLTAADPAPRTISVRGRAEVVFPPDHVVVHAAVTAKAGEARVAQKQAHEKATSILSFLRQAGVAADDLATDRTDLREVRDPVKEDCPPQPPRSHFEATVGVRFKIRDLPRFDHLLSGITDLGVNRIYAVTSESTRRPAKAKEARIQAVLAAYASDEPRPSLGHPDARSWAVRR